ncbi:MAG: hydroxymethylglutaryl-CoA reductase, degradative [Caldilineales bacterium]|nr:hydroxymethylglutaryl-CoA reductase, degradative [Caldilineales bacterium]
MTTNEHSSRLTGFYNQTIAERRDVIAAWAEFDAADRSALDGGLDENMADRLVENAIGLFSLPLAVAPNFVINGREIIIPLVIEEPSVVAAMANAARLARAGGGFRTGSSEPVMIGQMQLLDVPNPAAAAARILDEKEALLAQIADLHPTIRKLGGGLRDLQVRFLNDTPAGAMLVVHLLMDTRDAMGANAINTACETLAPELEALSGGRALLRILSNLSDQRLAWAECSIPVSAFASDEYDGEDVAQGIYEANAFALADPYRAATHNKGIFNGIDAVALATGQDWRAIGAGGHAYAARDGHYRALTAWDVAQGYLYGRLEMPLAVGTVGGMTRLHPAVRTNLRLLGDPNARELAEIIVAAGLAQNLAALRALVSEGIQRGHMALHARRQR